MSLRDRALGKPSRKQTTIHVPEWESDVVVRELDTDARLKFLATINPNDPRVDLSPLLPYLPGLVVDAETGKEAFEAADVDTLKAEHPGVVTRLLLASIDLSELGEVDAEDAVGNFEATPA